MIKGNRKADEAFDADYDYVYGIVSTGTLQHQEHLYEEDLDVSDKPTFKKRRVEEMNMVNVIEVIIIVTEDTKEKPFQ
ncbi:uncharacterized protein OCT59_022791 [Rhizophagus irregularis]|uniref:Uncharacterized protein n=1 Tax=Rhizophagus irregularis (strain DAOM 181602 / DAOM 197198 / MUCL 43194) TaxID=747089 RepID=U9TYM6_RHIID|nr:hypothetical protein OCT59_022791 [Rhizophagus irregularis]GBC49140.1 hypothetical protein GLOIN_2v1738235 [Rhizophagus irregularis DAOM 181602=DAOM 197198]